MPDDPTNTPPDGEDHDAQTKAMLAAAAHEELSAEEEIDAADYFLGKRPAPGASDRFSLRVDFGTIDAPAFSRVRFRALRVEEIETADQYGARKDPTTGEDTGTMDLYKRASMTFAVACQQPALGPIVQQRQAEAAAKLAADPDAKVWAPQNAAELVADLFKHAPGTLLQVADAIRRRQRGLGNDATVREVEAGKS